MEQLESPKAKGDQEGRGDAASSESMNIHEHANRLKRRHSKKKGECGKRKILKSEAWKEP